MPPGQDITTYFQRNTMNVNCKVIISLFSQQVAAAKANFFALYNQAAAAAAAAPDDRRKKRDVLASLEQQ